MSCDLIYIGWSGIAVNEFIRTIFIQFIVIYGGSNFHVICSVNINSDIINVLKPSIVV